MQKGVIPPEADEQVRTRWEDGAKQSAQYVLDGVVVGCRWWDADGTLTMEYGMQGGLQHGSFRTWHAPGVLESETTYVNGKEHGVARQYDAGGALIGTYLMQYGTGVDLWYERPGVLAEERSFLDGERHGFERWWNGDNATVEQESHFQHGTQHGITRRWNAHGRLARGFPQYFLHGKRVRKRQYLKACERDSSLPLYAAADDQPQRVLPPEMVNTNPSDEPKELVEEA